MRKPLFSVIIPAYNEEKLIHFCLMSVFSQDFPKDNYEVIVVDNNSTDKTAKIVKEKFPQVRLVKETQQGVVFARIKGVNEAKGKFIAFLDADSLAPKNWLLNIHRAFSDQDVVGVGGSIKFYPSSPSLELNERLNNSLYPPTRVMPGSNISFRKKAYSLCGGFSPKINLGEEIYISKKLRKVGRTIFLKDNPIITSPRRRLFTNWGWGAKYLLNFLAISLFDEAIFFHFQPIR